MDCRDCVHISGASRIIVCTIPIPVWAEGYRIIKDYSIADNCDCYEERKDKP